MPHKKPGKPKTTKNMTPRQKKLQAMGAARRKLGKGKAIVRTKDGKISSVEIVETSKRWNKREGKHVRSVTKIVKDIPAMDVARRLLSRDVLRNIEKIAKTKEDRNTIFRLVNKRYRKVPGTDIPLSQDEIVLMTKLLNRLGEKKTEQAIRILGKKAERIHKLIEKNNYEVYEKTERTDVMLNATINIQNLPMMYESIMMGSKEELAQEVEENINQKRKDLERLRNMDIKNKEYYLRNLRQNTHEAILELANFRMKYKIPF